MAQFAISKVQQPNIASELEENKENYMNFPLDNGTRDRQKAPSPAKLQTTLLSRPSQKNTLLPKTSSTWLYNHDGGSLSSRSQTLASKTVPSPIDTLISKFASQQISNPQHKMGSDSYSSSNTDPFAASTPETSLDRPDAAELFKLKKELELANYRMAQMDIQLANERTERLALAEIDLNQSQMAHRTVEAAIGSPFPTPQPILLPTNLLDPDVGGVSSGVSVPQWSVGQPFSPGEFPRSRQPYEHSYKALGHYGTESILPNGSILAARAPTHFEPYSPAISTLMPFVRPDSSKAGAWSQQVSVGPKSANAQNFANLPPSSWLTTQPINEHVANINEPVNYRRLLDRNMSCDWKFIVDKIICNNDQQASIFLQQKLKQGTPEQKFSIVQAIIDQAYPLMVNRFGNFLVQRCFEHGTPEQVVAIALAIRGNTLNLSMDAFGCHVVQKAFDCVPEEYKAVMVHELLRRVPETVIHRYACHVWQKLFELRWNDTPPQIMKYVNEALCGMWHEVALGETGSLVVQNIFENCLEDDKRPCITEVLNNIDIVAHGQFGNWCIQHICEHGSAPDRLRAIDHVVRFATEYSIDQFASKVVEKCLKVCGTDFLDRYLDRVCEARPDRPRMPLIDVAGDQFGNYLIQYILMQADTQRRELVANHIRKHLVSLRGSKYGSRVAMLCCNPSYASRSSTPAAPPMARYQPRFAEPTMETGPQGRGFNCEGQFSRNPRGMFGAPYR